MKYCGIFATEIDFLRVPEHLCLFGKLMFFIDFDSFIGSFAKTPPSHTSPSDTVQ